MRVIKKQHPKADGTIYLGIDHLKPGNYQLKITLGKEVVKIIQLNKEQ